MCVSAFVSSLHHRISSVPICSSSALALSSLPPRTNIRSNEIGLRATFACSVYVYSLIFCIFFVSVAYLFCHGKKDAKTLSYLVFVSRFSDDEALNVRFNLVFEPLCAFEKSDSRRVHDDRRRPVKHNELKMLVSLLSQLP